ncbi:MAG: hypothetical protein HY695_12280 [Deltaproteobacteria bacterium]|nr:hypothetical protein [Deltaproteobacteria bacterium]
MEAKELFDAGNLSAAIDQLNQDLKANPTDSHSRTFLFELLCFSGDLERAGRQLDTIAQLSGQVTVEIGVQLYRNILQAEKARRHLFTAGGQPKFLLEAPPYARLHLEAIEKLRGPNPAEASALLHQAGQLRSPSKGRLDGGSFEDFRDCDDLLAPFLEVIIQKEYAWLPFEQIQRVEISRPKRLRELIWVPAKVSLHEKPLGDVYLPVLYPRTNEDPNDLIKLGRMTDLKPMSADLVLGVGQRIFLAGNEEKPILEINEIEFQTGNS